MSFFAYNDKNKILGLSSKELYERSEKHTLKIEGKQIFEAVSAGATILYSRYAEGFCFGKRANGFQKRMIEAHEKMHGLWRVMRRMQTPQKTHFMSKPVL